MALIVWNDLSEDMLNEIINRVMRSLSNISSNVQVRYKIINGELNISAYLNLEAMIMLGSYNIEYKGYNKYTVSNNEVKGQLKEKDTKDTLEEAIRFAIIRILNLTSV